MITLKRHGHLYAAAWRVAIGDRADAWVHTSRGTHAWRRRWWRIWTADVLPYNRSALRNYVCWRIGQFRAAVALANDGVIGACDAMKALNRGAKYSAHSHEIYDLKRRFIGELLELYPWTATKHIQTQKCFGCHGTGTWESASGEYSDTCFRCRGSGIYSQFELILFAFAIQGRTYHWHQPAHFWPNIAAEGEAPYVEDRLSTGRPRPFISAGVGLRYETLMETVAQWVDEQGLALGLKCRRQRTIRGALKADLSRFRHRLKRAIERRFPKPDTDDIDLPF